ncbi:hypothetical protein [Nonomuraea jiangxiensis]|nr:hypothetical protein [Nonomuraea jiangxiensis]
MDDLTRDELRRAGAAAAGVVADHLAGVAGRPAWRPVPAAERA